MAAAWATKIYALIAASPFFYLATSEFRPTCIHMFHKVAQRRPELHWIGG